MRESTAFPDAALPAPLTQFVGRDADVESVTTLLGEARLVTLTGAGGSGKTRLAVEVARRIAEASPELAPAWVELASLGDPSAVAAHVAIALGIRTEGGGSTLRALTTVLQERDVLLVLDNCEHVVEACAAFVERLVQAAPRLRVLATSREALGVNGERSWLVPTLSLPAADCADPAVAVAASAVRLFVDRARDVNSRFTLSEANVQPVVAICRRLDGLPLAIELAAARIAVLSPAQLAQRLDASLDALGSGARAAPPRQRTLRGAVQWSYELLEDDERLLLDRLSIFVGGFTLETAEAVCGFAPLPAPRVLELLAALATKSLLSMDEEQGQARYRLLEIIREYARERQALRDEDESLAARHAEAMRALVSRVASDVILGRDAQLHELDLEHGNLMAALAWSARARRGDDIGLPIVFGLLWYWYHRQRWDEGFACSEAALASAHAPSDTMRAAALHGLGVFGLHTLKSGCREWLEEARRLWRASGHERWYAFATLVAVVEASLRGDVAGARAFAEEMLAVAQRQPDPWDAALAKAHAMVPVLNWQGEWAAAARLLDEALVTFRAREFHSGVAYVLDAKAYVALRMDDLEGAGRLARESLRSERLRENRWLAGRSLRILASVAHRRGQRARALRLFGITDGWYAALGASSLTGERQVVNDLRAVLRADATPAEWAAEYERGIAMGFRDAIAFALADAEATDATAAAMAHPSAAAVEDAERLPTPPAARIEVRALGRVEVLRDGQALGAEDWPYAKPRELLLYLLSYPEGRTRDQIGLEFWPDASAAQVKNNFHVTLHHLRKTLGEGRWVQFTQGRYRAGTDALRFDVAEFMIDAEAALKQLKRRPGDAAALRQLEAAVARYRGPFAEGEAFGDWHLAQRDMLARLHEAALLALGEAASVDGQHADAAEWFRRVLAVDPLHEEAVRLLVMTLARDERRSEAIRAYEKYTQDLQQGLAARPTAALQQLMADILAGERV